MFQINSVPTSSFSTFPFYHPSILLLPFTLCYKSSPYLTRIFNLKAFFFSKMHHSFPFSSLFFHCSPSRWKVKWGRHNGVVGWGDGELTEGVPCAASSLENGRKHASRHTHKTSIFPAVFLCCTHAMCQCWTHFTDTSLPVFFQSPTLIIHCSATHSDWWILLPFISFQYYKTILLLH